jgi:hypothetical protein
MICISDRSGPLSSGHMLLLQRNMGMFSRMLFLPVSYSSTTCSQDHASDNRDEREVHAARFCLSQHDESQNGCAQRCCCADSLHDVDHLFRPSIFSLPQFLPQFPG